MSAETLANRVFNWRRNSMERLNIFPHCATFETFNIIITKIPPCELVYVAIERIKPSNSQKITPELSNIPLYKKRPICLDSENTLIFGEKIFHAYKKHRSKKTISAWRLSLLDLAKGSHNLIIQADQCKCKYL